MLLNISYFIFLIELISMAKTAKFKSEANINKKLAKNFQLSYGWAWYYNLGKLLNDYTIF